MRGGFILPVMLVVGFVVSLGAATLTSRSLFLRLGDGLQDQGRESRDAAESGFEAVLAELNRDENRLLAAASIPLSDWSAGDERLRNPCHRNATIAPSTEALNLARGAWRSVPNNPNLRYRIRSAEVKNATRTDRLRTTLFPSGGGPPTSRATGTYDPSRFEFEQLPEHKLSRLELSIEGQSLRNGQPVASSVITQELGVVPKCCGVSIGDTDTVPENYCASRFPRLIVGLNGGGVMNAGGRSELVEQVAGSNRSSTNLPNQVLCVNSSGVCGGAVTSSVGGVPISTIKLTPPPLPAYPAVDNRTNTATGNTGMIIHSNTAIGATSTLATSANAKDYLRVNSSGVVQLCNVTNTALQGLAEPPMPQAFVNSSCDSTINQFCARTGNSSENYTYHCRIARLHVRDQVDSIKNESGRIQNNTFFIDSSRGRIFLHFNQSWINPASCGLPEDSPSIETICTQAGFNDGQIQHLHCSTAPNDSSPCNLRAAPDNAARAGLYSDAPINLKVGDDGYVRDLFVYMPKGSLILAEDPYTVDNAFGVPNYRGPLWINNLWMGVRGDVAYQTQIAMPPYSSSFTGLGKPSIDNPFRLMPFYEWIVRGSSFRTGYGSTGSS